MDSGPARGKRGAIFDAGKPNTTSSISESKESGGLLSKVKTEVIEDEIKRAELEVKLRDMVLEVVTPTVERAVKLQNHCDFLTSRLENQHDVLTLMAKDVHAAMEKLDLVSEFKVQLDGFWDSQRDLEAKLAKHTKEVMSKVEHSAQSLAAVTSQVERLNKQILRVQEDTDFIRSDMAKVQNNVDLGIKKNKDFIDSELRRMEFNIKQVKDMHHALSDEIWGPEEVTHFSAPSLRRFDMQTREMQQTLREVHAELKELRLLDVQMKRVTEVQGEHGTQLDTLNKQQSDLEQKTDTINKDLNADLRKTANLMAAYSANLMHNVRGSFLSEVKELSALHEGVQRFLKETDESVKTLSESLHASGLHLEACMREVRLDLEGLDAKRKKDKLGLEDSINSLGKQASSSRETDAQLAKSLEHVSGVVGMALQGQRMLIALGVQDFVDRKDTLYIGLKKQDKQRGIKTGGALDLTFLSTMPYQPQEINFLGKDFERPQLLALCEKLVFSGQEALGKGPGTQTKGVGKDIWPGGLDGGATSFVAQKRSSSRGASRGFPEGGKDDRPSTTASTAKPMTADSTSVHGTLGGYSRPETSESSRLPQLSCSPGLPLTAR
eukprot:TRINITY_DN42122_c0_g1_i1.p1 TRINITY_DN42122_c0_g1~~TRINITY_DN42122_c0_g1_i1.p1  ORF type:complete len:608 (-),score=144.86 TRINITY_DN42122_c0_g1_i1:74-1897(-)